MTTSRREVPPTGRSADASRAQKSAIKKTQSTSTFQRRSDVCPSISRPSGAPALGDLVPQNRLRAAGRASRRESVLRWTGKRQIDSFLSKTRSRTHGTYLHSDAKRRSGRRPVHRQENGRSNHSYPKPSRKHAVLIFMLIRNAVARRGNAQPPGFSPASMTSPLPAGLFCSPAPPASELLLSPDEALLCSCAVVCAL